MTILIHLLLVIIGLAVVIFGANFLIDGASAFAKKYNIPNIVIGLTIVSFGTSAPELVVSLYSGYTGNGDIALGNIVGSNIANIMLILGVTAMIVPLKILRNTVSKEIPLSLLAAVILYFLINDKLYGASTIDIISLSDGIVLLGFFVIFMYYMVHLTKNSQEEEALDIKNWSKAKSLMIATGGLGALVIGGKLFVDNASILALQAGIPNAVVGITIVAIGTSLPELATSIVAALKGNADIAVGNVVGSNIFNIFMVLGLCSTITPLAKGSITQIDLWACIGASLLLFIFSLLLGKYKIVRVEGTIMLTLYMVYIGYQISIVF